jgi:hypothetical protein
VPVGGVDDPAAREEADLVAQIAAGDTGAPVTELYRLPRPDPDPELARPGAPVTTLSRTRAPGRSRELKPPRNPGKKYFYLASEPFGPLTS